MQGLKNKRKEKGMTQREIAELLMIRQNTFSQYECGKREPKIAVLKKMSEIFGCSIEELL